MMMWFRSPTGQTKNARMSHQVVVQEHKQTYLDLYIQAQMD